MNNSKNLICLKEAAKISGYHQDYLGYLVRKGKLNGRKIGRSWMTTKSDLDAFLNSRSTSFIRDIIFSRFGLSVTLGILLTLIIGVTFFVAIEIKNIDTKSADIYVEDQLNLSPTDNLPLIEN